MDNYLYVQDDIKSYNNGQIFIRAGNIKPHNNGQIFIRAGRHKTTQ